MSLPVNFVQQFSDNLIVLAQQKGSRLRQYCRHKPFVGKSAYFDRLAPTAAVKKTSRHQDTPLIDSEHSRRRVTVEDWIWADLVDSEDELRLLIDPKSDYAQNAVNALGRAMDDAIIAAVRGDSYAMDEDDAASVVTLPSAQKVAIDFKIGGGGSNSGLTIDKLLEAKRLLDAAEIDPDEERVMVVSAYQLQNLLNTTAVQSADFNTVKALVNGQINTFAGFNFVRSERLVKSGTTQYVLAWLRSGVGLAVNQDIVSKMDTRPDKNYATQVFAKATFGSVRIEEEKVVEVACLIP